MPKGFLIPIHFEVHIRVTPSFTFLDVKLGVTLTRH